MFALCAKAAETLSWSRSWLDEIQLRWQPPVISTDGMQPFSIENWQPEFSYDVSSRGTATDGKYVYSGASIFKKYDMEGNFLEEFSIPGLPEIYDITYDGRYFYATSYEAFGIFVIDFDNKELVKIIPTKQQMYHICYIPTLDGGKGGFGVGNPKSGFFLRMDGTQLDGELNYAEDMGAGRYCFGTTYMNGKLYIYCGNQTPKDRVVMEYDLSTMEHTGKTFDVYAHAGQGGIEQVYVPRKLFTYTYPDNKQYLMVIDYNNFTYRVSCLLSGENPIIEGLTGYDVYRNNEKVNEETLDKEIYIFSDKGLEEQTAYNYEIRAAGGDNAGQVLFSNTVELPATDNLPLADDFQSYSMTLSQASSRLFTNFWEITPKMPEQRWSVIGVDNKYIQFHYSPDTKYRQTIVSKPLTSTDGNTVSMQLRYACPYFGQGANNEVMTVQVTTDGGETWTEVGSIPFKSNTSFVSAQFDLTQHVAGKTFQVRLKGNGDSVDVSYNWQIDDIKIWEYKNVATSGKVLFVGQPVDKPIDLQFVLKDVGTTYTATTDAEGAFDMGEIESGLYDVTVQSGKFTYVAENVIVEDGKTEYTIDVPGGYFTGTGDTLKFRVAPDDMQTMPYTFTNSGNTETTSKVTLGFDDLPEGEVTGNNDLATTPEWSVGSSFDLQTRGELALVFYKGSFYLKSNDYQNFKLNRYSTDGVLEEEGINYTPTSTLPNTINGCCTIDGKVYVFTSPKTYGTPQVPAYLIPVDMETKEIVVEEKIALDNEIKSIRAVAYDPNEQMYYVKDGSNALFKLDKNGAFVKKYTMPNLYYDGLVIDTFSAGGPYLWMTEKSNSPLGFSIMQYSLETEQFTMNKHVVNDNPESILANTGGNSRATIAMSLTGSTQITPGFFTIALSQNISNYSDWKGQVLTYPIFAIETWMKTSKGEIAAAQEETNIGVTVDATGLADGTVKTGMIKISSSNPGKDLVIPVELTVDESVAEQYPGITDLAATVNDNFEVELAWEQPESSNEVEAYYIIRDGKELETRSESTSYTDYMPIEGTQTYKICTLYKSGYRVVSDAEVSAQVNNPVWGQPVSGFDATIKGRNSVQLRWDITPHYRSAFFDDFESYEPFIIENIGEWTLVDNDRMWTYENNQVDYMNEGERMAGIIYNPSATVPAQTEMLDNGSAQAFAFTSGRIPQLSNDDWLISPELSLKGNSTFRFDAKAASSNYGKEKINVLYSTTGKEVEDFIQLNKSEIEVDKIWSAIEYDVPVDTKYVAIHYVSKNTYKLYIDNVFVGQESGYSPASGFNVYRDGIKLNDELVSANTFSDYNLSVGSHKYTVEVVFENGATAITEPQEVNVTPAFAANPPQDLTLNETEPGVVRLDWNAPEAAEKLELRYDDGTVANSLGGVERTYVSVRWDADEMRYYNGYSITGIHFHIAEPVVSVTPILFMDNIPVRTGDTFVPEPGVYNDYEFSRPLKIEEGHSYMAGYYAVVEEGRYPLSHDAGPGVAGKSDLISSDGANWYSMLELYQDSEFALSWNIAANLEIIPEPGILQAPEPEGLPELPKTTSESRPRHNAQKAATRFAAEAVNQFRGYNVYRNGVKINELALTELSYTDNPDDNATYHVTAIWSNGGEVASNEVQYIKSSVELITDDVCIYPNPVSEYLNISAAFDRIYMHSINGQLVYQNDKAADWLTIPVSGFAQGAYIVTIINGSTAEHHKVIVK